MKQSVAVKDLEPLIVKAMASAILFKDSEHHQVFEVTRLIVAHLAMLMDASDQEMLKFRDQAIEHLDTCSEMAKSQVEEGGNTTIQ